MQNRQDKGGETMKRFKKGQSVLEYVLVLAAIIAAIAVVATTKIGGGVTKALGTAGDKIGNVSF
jgi:hypothetical protein